MSDVYADIADWADDGSKDEQNYPMSDYKTYADWYGAIKQDFKDQGHFFPPGTETGLRDRWNDAHPEKPQDTNEQLLEKYTNQSQSGQKIYDTMRAYSHRETFSPKELANLTDIKKGTVYTRLRSMQNDGLIVRKSRGQYQVISYT